MHVWSERRGDRARELAADVVTLLWIAVWASLGLNLYRFLAELAAAGRFVRDGGSRIVDAGARVGSALEGVPLIGADVGGGVRAAFNASGEPLIRFGSDLERLLLVVAALLGLLLVAVAVVPWLNRYLPWRVARWRRLNAGARVIRRSRARKSEPVPDAEMARVLASRAIHRLEYDELLEFTPDPIGDWIAGRHERLMQAELDRVGLRGLVAAR